MRLEAGSWNSTHPIRQRHGQRCHSLHLYNKWDHPMYASMCADVSAAARTVRHQEAVFGLLQPWIKNIMKVLYKLCSTRVIFI